MKVTVLGAGAWGTALAINAAGRHDVTLWARDAQQVQSLAGTRRNTRYLPGIALPPQLRVVAGAALDATVGAELLIIATPMAALRQQLIALRDLELPVAWLCKGIEPARNDTDANTDTDR